MNRIGARHIGTAASLLAVLLWFGVTGWHGVVHPTHGALSHHAGCDAEHHGPTPAKQVHDLAWTADSNTTSHDSHPCLACTVASSAAVQLACAVSTLPVTYHAEPVQPDSGVLPSAPLGAFRLRGPPA